MNKTEFSKILLYLDYLFMVVLVFLTVKFPDIDFITLDIAWIAQLGISSTAYYWKSKSDNKTKIPIKVVSSLPKSMRENIDITQVIVASIQSE